MVQDLGEHLHLPEAGPTSKGSNPAAQRHFNVRAGKTGLRAGPATLWDLTPDGLRWSRCHDNRNKGHSKCDVLESSPNHSHPLSDLCKHCLPGNWPHKGWKPLEGQWVHRRNQSSEKASDLPTVTEQTQGWAGKTVQGPWLSAAPHGPASSAVRPARASVSSSGPPLLPISWAGSPSGYGLI